MQLKNIIFAALFILFSIIFFWSIKNSFNHIDSFFDNWKNLIIAVIGFSVAFVLFVLNSFKNKKINLAVFGIIGILAFVFAPVFNFYIFLSIILLLISLFFGSRRIKDELIESYKMNFYEAIDKGLRLAFEGVMVFIIIFYFFAPAGAILKDKDIEIPKPLFDKIFNIVIKNLISDNNNSFGLLRNFKAGNTLKVKELNIIETQLSNSILNSLNISLKNFIEPYKNYVPIILAFGLYLTVRFFAIFIRLLSSFLSWFIIKFLFLFKVMRKKTITIEREYFE